MRSSDIATRVMQMRHPRRAFERFVKGDASHQMVEQLNGEKEPLRGKSRISREQTNIPHGGPK